jgi:predicted metal-dependent hydrolase
MDERKADMLRVDDALEYSVRVSARAKRLQLKVTAWGQVEVVVPRHVAISHAAPFVLKYRKWLQSTLAAQRALRDTQPALDSLAPDRVTLAALDEEWQVVYVQGSRMRIHAAIEEDGRRLLRIETPDVAAAHLSLQHWMQDYARLRLIPWLRTVSEECRLPFARATVRVQKTRWGSCTARGHISLNRHLLFLPPQLVRYLFIHELCHTVHLNHSRRYWALVSRHAPDYATHEAELRQAALAIPRWACVR